MKRPYDKRTIRGLVITAIWLGTAVGITIWKRDMLAGMELNEMGDFLAGFFAPLGFLWLVIGYFQQGQELQQNTDALRLQAEELKNSVAEQKALVLEQQAMAEATRRHVDLIETERKEKWENEIRLNRPNFRHVNTRTGGPWENRQRMIFEVQNYGGSVSSVDVHCSETDILTGPNFLPHFDAGQAVGFSFDFFSDRRNYDFLLEFGYIDKLGHPGKSSLYVTVQDLQFTVKYPFPEIKASAI